MDFSHRFDMSVTIQSQTGTTISGDPIWESPKRTILGKKDTVTRRSFSPSSGEQFAQVDIFVTDQVLLPGDRYWPAGADTNNALLAKRLQNVTQRGTLDSGYVLYRGDL